MKMIEDFFIIPTNNLSAEHLTLNLEHDFFALEYCENELDIPLYYISEATYTDEGLEIGLTNLERQIMMEDWYIQLCRLSSYARAS
jgi:hypothetical protein